MSELANRMGYASYIADLLHLAKEWNEVAFRLMPDGGKIFGQFFNSAVRQLNGESKDPADKDAAEYVMQLPYQKRREVYFTMMDIMVRELWSKHRIVYEIDRDAWASIGSAKPDSMIPREVLYRLPYPDPFLVFPEPILIDHGEEWRQKLVGVYVLGVAPAHPNDPDDESNVYCSTHDPKSIGWSFQFAGLVEDRDGQPVYLPKAELDFGLVAELSPSWLRAPYLPYLQNGQPLPVEARNRLLRTSSVPRRLADRVIDAPHAIQDVMWTRTSFRMTHDMTLQEMLTQSLKKFDAISDHLAFGDHTQDLPLMLSRAINLMVYLATVNKDLQPVPRPPASRRPAGKNNGPKPPKPIKLIRIGYRVGAELRTYAKRQRSEDYAPGTGKKKAPHLRRSHMHTYRVGPGRTEKIIKWIPPIPINMKFGPEVNTVVPVRNKKRR